MTAALNAPEKGLSWKSVIIATIAVVFVIVLLAAIFTSRASVRASGKTSTSEQLFPPQYVTMPTPVIVTTAAQNAQSGSSGRGYFSANGSVGANFRRTAGSAGAGSGSYPTWHDTYTAVAYNPNAYQQNYPVWQSQYNYYPAQNYGNYGNYGNYPVWHDPYPYGYPQGYATYPNYPVWHN